MTAEACVMNKLGLALAADSAVTSAQAGGPKIYQSADKLFLLSRAEPVAAMFYGSASLLGVPWETTIKRYRNLRGHHSHDTVESHAASFLSFLEKDRTLFPQQRQKRDIELVARSLYAQVREDFIKKTEKQITEKGAVAEADVATLLGDTVREHLKELRSMDKDDRLPRSFGTTIGRMYSGVINEQLRAIFESLPLSASTRNGLRRLVTGFLTRKWPSEQAGVVVAGFGQGEVFPSLVDIKIDTLVANRLKSRVRSVLRVTDENSSYIVPFAQGEMVYTFMEGIDPQLEVFMARSIETIFQELPEAIASAVVGLSDARRRSLRTKLSRASLKMVTKLREQWVEYRRANHVDPVMSIVSMLPKDELASLAEALVNLTVLKRRTSTEAETVGGPIDVAVITKGDGFVWIKRKHYFDPALNPRYMAKLAKGERE